MGDRLNALIEVALVYISILLVPMFIVPLIYWAFSSYLEFSILGYTPYTMICYLVYLALVLIIMMVTRRDLNRFGVSKSDLHMDLKVVGICIVTLFIVPQIIFFLPWNLIGLAGDLWNTVLGIIVSLLMLIVTAMILAKISRNEDKAITGILLVIPALILPSMNLLSPLAASLLYFFIIFFFFVGPIEELLHRGYIQTRLNEIFGRPYQFFGVRVGIGLIISSLLFGLAHIFNYDFNLLTGHYSLDWAWGISTFFAGLTFGYLREKTGNITASSIFHGAFDFLSTLPSLL